jgi:hypothetical protein
MALAAKPEATPSAIGRPTTGQWEVSEKGS